MHACILRSPSKVPIPSRWSFYIVYVLVRTVGESRASGRYACLASSTVRAPSLVRYIPRSHTSSAGSSSSDYGVLLRFSWRTEGAGVQTSSPELLSLACLFYSQCTRRLAPLAARESGRGNAGHRTCAVPGLLIISTSGKTTTRSISIHRAPGRACRSRCVRACLHNICFR